MRIYIYVDRSGLPTTELFDTSVNLDNYSPENRRDLFCMGTRSESLPDAMIHAARMKEVSDRYLRTDQNEQPAEIIVYREAQ